MMIDSTPRKTVSTLATFYLPKMAVVEMFLKVTSMIDVREKNITVASYICFSLL